MELFSLFGVWVLSIAAYGWRARQYWWRPVEEEPKGWQFQLVGPLIVATISVMTDVLLKPVQSSWRFAPVALMIIAGFTLWYISYRGFWEFAIVSNLRFPSWLRPRNIVLLLGATHGLGVVIYFGIR